MSSGAAPLAQVPHAAQWGPGSRGTVLCLGRRSLRICAVAAIRTIDTRPSPRDAPIVTEVELDLMRDCDRDGMLFLMQLASPPPGKWFCRRQVSCSPYAAVEAIPLALTAIHTLSEPVSEQHLLQYFTKLTPPVALACVRRDTPHTS